MANGTNSMPRTGAAGEFGGFAINKKLREFQSEDLEHAQMRYNALTLGGYEYYESLGLNGGSNTQKVVEGLGLDDKPVVVSQDEFDKIVEENGYIPLWRGVYSVDPNGREVAMNTMFGDRTYVGDGIHGDGIYFSTDYDTANGYSGGGGLNGDAKGYGIVMAAVINPKKAHIITEQALYDMFNKDLAKSGLSTFEINMDLSSYALYKGYNVIHVPGGNAGQYGSTYAEGGEDYYVPIERSALVFAELSPF